MSDPTDTPSTDGAPDPKHTISLANIDRGTPEWRLRCHHGADEFRCYTETGEVDPLREGQCVLMDWWGEYGIELVDIREAIPALPIAVEADWNGDSWDLTLAAAGLRVVPEDRPTPQLPSTFCATCERYVECADDGGWTHVMSRSYGPDDFDHRVSGVTKLCGFCDAMYDLLNDEDATHHACGYCVDDDEPAGVPALDDDTRREVERIVEHLRHDVDVIDQGAYEDMAQVSRSIDRAAELLVAAYLGGTDGR